MMRDLLKKQARRAYAGTFQVVHFSIQSDHVHLIVEATSEGLSQGIRGFAISFARQLNARLDRKGKVWADRHYRRDLSTPTETRNTLVYVLQNYVHHGVRTFGEGVVDPYSTSPRFDGWADDHAKLIEAESWPSPKPRTWMLNVGWKRARGGLLRTSEAPRIAKFAKQSAIVAAYVPDRVSV
jgi:REP element-mobilizing transposase RayT